jgi:hypothetical protein
MHEECVHVLETNPHDDDNFFEGEETINERMEMLLKEVERPILKHMARAKIATYQVY